MWRNTLEKLARPLELMWFCFFFSANNHIRYMCSAQFFELPIAVTFSLRNPIQIAGPIENWMSVAPVQLVVSRDGAGEVSSGVARSRNGFFAIGRCSFPIRLGAFTWRDLGTGFRAVTSIHWAPQANYLNSKPRCVMTSTFRRNSLLEVVIRRGLTAHDRTIISRESRYCDT